MQLGSLPPSAGLDPTCLAPVHSPFFGGRFPLKLPVRDAWEANVLIFCVWKCLCSIFTLDWKFFGFFYLSLAFLNFILIALIQAFLQCMDWALRPPVLGNYFFYFLTCLIYFFGNILPPSLSDFFLELLLDLWNQLIKKKLYCFPPLSPPSPIFWRFPQNLSSNSVIKFILAIVSDF